MRTAIMLHCTSFFFLVGCAELSTINRSHALPGAAGGIAIHLDAPQRLAFSKDGIVCAEPTPDALQSYAASFGGGLSIPTQGSASLAAAFGGSAASIGLHTQSITLMRDALYRICEASYNNTVNKGDVVALMERSQDLTLGVLAIEQLTGAVVARQAILSGASNASGSGSIGTTQAQLDEAQKNEALKKAAQTSATSARDKQKTAIDQTTKDLEAAKAKAASTLTTISTLTDKLKTQQEQLSKEDANVKAAKETRDKAKGVFAKTTQDRDSAKTDLKALPGKINKLTSDLSTQKAQLTKDDSDLIAAERAHATKQNALDVAIANLRTELAKPSPDPATVAKLNGLVTAARDVLEKENTKLSAAKAKQSKQKELVDKTIADAAKANADLTALPDTIVRLDTSLNTQQGQVAKDDEALTGAMALQKQQQAVVAQTDKDLKAAKENQDFLAVAELTKRLETQGVQLANDEAAVKTAEANYTSAQRATEAIQAHLNSAITATQAGATGAGVFSTGIDRNNIDKDTVAELAKATESIVYTVINKGRVAETCLNLMSAYAKETDSAKLKGWSDLAESCKEYLTIYMTAWVDAVKRPGQGGKPIPLPQPKVQGSSLDQGAVPPPSDHSVLQDEPPRLSPAFEPPPIRIPLPTQ